MGKSSLINCILSGRAKAPSSFSAAEKQKKGQHALTSKTPGKTNRIHFFKLPSMILGQPTLVDCPGYGFAKASHVDKENWRKFMEIYL